MLYVVFAQTKSMVTCIAHVIQATMRHRHSVGEGGGAGEGYSPKHFGRVTSLQAKLSF